MDTKLYESSPNRLLVEIGFAGAQYGLVMPVISVARYLGYADNTRPASLMILGVLSIATKDYDGAIKLFKGVAENPSYSQFCDQAKQLEEVAIQIAKKR